MLVNDYTTIEAIRIRGKGTKGSCCKTSKGEEGLEVTRKMSSLRGGKGSGTEFLITLYLSVK